MSKTKDMIQNMIEADLGPVRNSYYIENMGDNKFRMVTVKVQGGKIIDTIYADQNNIIIATSQVRFALVEDLYAAARTKSFD